MCKQLFVHVYLRYIIYVRIMIQCIQEYILYYIIIIFFHFAQSFEQFHFHVCINNKICLPTNKFNDKFLNIIKLK